MRFHKRIPLRFYRARIAGRSINVDFNI